MSRKLELVREEKLFRLLPGRKQPMPVGHREFARRQAKSKRAVGIGGTRELDSHTPSDHSGDSSGAA